MLEVGDQLRAVVANRLLATIDRHVLSKLIDRLLADSDRFAIARRADHTERGQAELEARKKRTI